MAIELDPCVEAILCGLSNATILAIKGLITAQIAVVTTQIVAVEAQILKYDLLAQGVQAIANVVEGEVQTLRAEASLVPLNLIGGCLNLGDLNLSIQQTIDASLASFEQLTFQLTRILSFQDELNLLDAQLHETLDLYNAVLNTISVCGAGGGVGA